jgi:hypothetical protein
MSTRSIWAERVLIEHQDMKISKPTYQITRARSKARIDALSALAGRLEKLGCRISP